MDKLKDLGFALMLFTIGMTQIIVARGEHYTEFSEMVGLIVLMIGLMMVLVGVVGEDE